MGRAARVLLACALGAAALAGGVVALDRAFPPDLSRAAASSTLVLDREERLLRAFVTADGKWRLPARVDDVDPRYVAMLLAYEDRRFHAHPGVDPVALARAAWQALRSGRVVSGGSKIGRASCRERV